MIGQNISRLYAKSRETGVIGMREFGLISPGRVVYRVPKSLS
jgi:hypothetical protein